MVFCCITQFVCTRYNSEEVFFDRCNNIYRHSICSAVWSYTDRKLSSWDFCCFHFNASGIKIERVLPLVFSVFSLGADHLILILQFFSPLSKVKDDQQNGTVELIDVRENHRYLLV